MEVIRAEQEAAQVFRRHGFHQVRQVVAGRTIAQHDVHAGAQPFFYVVEAEAFVVRTDLCRCIGLQVFAMQARAVAVDGLPGVVGSEELIEDGVIAIQDARAVHEFTDAEDAVIRQGRGHIRRFQDGAAVVERRRRHARRHHEADVEGRFLGGLHHVLKACEAADIDDFVGIRDNRRRSQGHDEAAEFFRADVGRFDVDMAFDQARRGIRTAGIDDFFPFIGTADAGDNAVGNDDVPFPYRLRIDVDDLAVLKDQVARFLPPGHGDAPLQLIPCHCHHLFSSLSAKGIIFYLYDSLYHNSAFFDKKSIAQSGRSPYNNTIPYILLK